MPRPTSKNSDDVLWADAFGKLLSTKAREPEGPGWLTALQIAKKTHRSLGHVRIWLKGELKAGRMQVFKGVQRSSEKRYSKLWWYKPVSG